MRTAASRCGLAVFLSHFDAFLLHMTVAATTAAVTGRIAAAVRDAAPSSAAASSLLGTVIGLTTFSSQMVQAVSSPAWEASAVSSIVKEWSDGAVLWRG